jgi:hypothetical protein
MMEISLTVIGSIKPEDKVPGTTSPFSPNFMLFMQRAHRTTEYAI